MKTICVLIVVVICLKQISAESDLTSNAKSNVVHKIVEADEIGELLKKNPDENKDVLDKLAKKIKAKLNELNMNDHPNVLHQLVVANEIRELLKKKQDENKDMMDMNSNSKVLHEIVEANVIRELLKKKPDENYDMINDLTEKIHRKLNELNMHLHPNSVSNILPKIVEAHLVEKLVKNKPEENKEMMDKVADTVKKIQQIKSMQKHSSEHNEDFLERVVNQLVHVLFKH